MEAKDDEARIAAFKGVLPFITQIKSYYDFSILLGENLHYKIIYNLPGINEICSRVDPMCFCAASKGVLVTIVENLLVAMAAKDGLEGTKTQIKQLATLLDFALRFDQQKVAARLSTHIQSYTKVHVRNL